MKYTFEKLSDDQWQVTCPDTSTYHSFSLDEALEFLREHLAAGGDVAPGLAKRAAEAEALDGAMAFLAEAQRRQREDEGGEDV